MLSRAGPWTACVLFPGPVIVSKPAFPLTAIFLPPCPARSVILL